MLLKLNIDKEVASKVGKELRNLTVQVEHETVTETDVVFIVDTLQKVTSVEEELPPSTIQDILDTVNEVSQFPESSLQAAQNLSDATNRFFLFSSMKNIMLLVTTMNLSFPKIQTDQSVLEVFYN